MKHTIQRWLLATGALFALTSAASAQEGQQVIRDRSIAYVITMEEWAMHKTPGAKAECPNGMNEGPREQFKAYFPEGTKRTVVGTQLARESQVVNDLLVKHLARHKQRNTGWIRCDQAGGDAALQLVDRHALGAPLGNARKRIGWTHGGR